MVWVEAVKNEMFTDGWNDRIGHHLCLILGWNLEAMLILNSISLNEESFRLRPTEDSDNCLRVVPLTPRCNKPLPLVVQNLTEPHPRPVSLLFSHASAKCPAYLCPHA